MKYLSLLIILLFTSSICAQNLKFGKVSKEDFLKYSSTNDSSVGAEFLYKKVNISFAFDREKGFIQEREVHERIIINNKDGFLWATKRIRLYDLNNANSYNLIKLKGITYSIENGELVKSKLKKDAIFDEEVNKFWALKTFTMPNIKEGCVVEYSYTIQSPYTYIDDIDFQSTIPIRKLDVKVRTPEYYKYSKILNPKAFYIPEIKESTQNRIIRDQEKREKKFKSTTTLTRATEFQFLENIYEVNSVNVPKLIKEPFIDNIHNYKSKLVLELNAIDYPNQVIKLYTTSWEALVENIYNRERFGGELNKSNYYKNEIEGLNLDEDNTVLNILKIFGYVKSKVRWNGSYGYLVENGVKKSFKEGSGNIADINLMLVSMLRESNIKANPVLVSAKGNGVPIVPTIRGFNYVICMVETDDGYLLLDASDVNSSINVLPERALNWKGRVVRENGQSSWVNLQTKKSSLEIVTVDVAIDADLQINGKYKARFTDYLAKRYRDKYKGINISELIKIEEENKGDIVIEGVEVKNGNKPNQPFDLSFDYKLNNEIDDVGDNLYFNPMLFLSLSANPYKLEKRNYPISLDFTTSTKYVVNIIIPDGYSVITIPESVIYQLPDNKAVFSYRIKQLGNVLLVSLDLKINTAYILPEDYEDVKMFYNAMIEKQAEQIVLTKV